MELGSYLKVALGNIISSKMRSALTLLGVLVGTASVVALVSGGELATQQALSQFKNMGTDLLSVSIQINQQQSGAQKLNIKDVDTLQNAHPDIIYAAPYTTLFNSIQYEGEAVNGSVVGANSTFADVVKLNIDQGRFISGLDNNELFGVIGHGIANTLLQKGEFIPIGKHIQVGDIFFKVIGVADEWEQNFFVYTDLNNSLIVPLELSLTMSKYANINNIIFKLKQDANLKQVQAAIDQKLKLLLPEAKLFFRSASQILDSMTKQSRTFTILLGFIGGISLLVGGIGVMNIMLVSVVERRREIGIRMAIGAHQRDIQMMFITESVVLCVFGGLLGILIGVAASWVTADISKWAFHLFILPPAIGFLVSVLVGIFFGFYPAYRASRMDPIECLTAE